MTVVVGYDVTAANIGQAPAGAQLAGYSTGGDGIEWSAADWAAHPGALRICQDTGASDATADYLDVERYAATNDDAAGWYKRAYAAFWAVARAGQRHPGIYTSMDNVTPLVNALIAGGVSSGPKLIVADWDDSNPEATAAVQSASGPFPVVGVQYADAGDYDVDVWSAAWLSLVSAPYPGHGEPPVTLVKVPAIMGLELTGAQDALESAGLASRVSFPLLTSAWDAMEVWSQTPTAGTAVPAGSNVDYAVR